MRVARLLLLAGLVALPALAHADPDREAYELGVVALQKKDCSTAADAFDRVKGPLAKDPSYIHYAALANECAGRLEKALSLFRKDEDTATNREKIGTLLYLIQKKAAEPLPTPAPTDGRSAVTFRVANAKQRFDVSVVTSQGLSSCPKQVTFLEPCTLPLPPGPAKVKVKGSGSFSGGVIVPSTPAEVAISHDGHHGMTWAGLGIVIPSLALVGVGLAQDPCTHTPGIPNDTTCEPNPANILPIGFGAMGALIGGSLIVLDAVRDRSNHLELSQGQSSGISGGRVGVEVRVLPGGAMGGISVPF